MVERLDPTKTALLIIDPQNDFLSSGGVMWDKVGNGVKDTNVVEHLIDLKKTARKVGVPVFYSPHYYTDDEFKSWKHLNAIDKIMFDRKMYRKGT